MGFLVIDHRAMINRIYSITLDLPTHKAATNGGERAPLGPPTTRGEGGPRGRMSNANVTLCDCEQKICG